MKAIISGTGSYLPDKIVKNKAFIHNEFYDASGVKNEKAGEEIVAKLEAITGIRERRYIADSEDSVPIMVRASQQALADAGITTQDLDAIIVAHNAGNMLEKGCGFHPVPNLAAHLKHALAMENYQCPAYDLLFGCPGWLQGVIQAKQIIYNGDAENVLVVGLEVASRMLDPHDLDSMIMADGCGACIVSKSTTKSKGILSYTTFSHAQDDLKYISLGNSNDPQTSGNSYFKMSGKDVYKYATTWVPLAVKSALEKANKNIKDVDMFLFHQANGKMLKAIANNIAQLYAAEAVSFEGKIPTTIEFLGNTSVATIPTMLDMIRKKHLKGFRIKKGQLVVFASVGAGMHCNAMVYQF